MVTRSVTRTRTPRVSASKRSSRADGTSAFYPSRFLLFSVTPLNQVVGVFGDVSPGAPFGD
jgi:hypothetical protein